MDFFYGIGGHAADGVRAGTVALAGSARHYPRAQRICAGGRVTGKVRIAPQGICFVEPVSRLRSSRWHRHIDMCCCCGQIISPLLLVTGLVN